MWKDDEKRRRKGAKEGVFIFIGGVRSGVIRRQLSMYSVDH